MLNPQLAHVQWLILKDRVKEMMKLKKMSAAERKTFEDLNLQLRDLENNILNF